MIESMKWHCNHNKTEKIGQKSTVILTFVREGLTLHKTSCTRQ